MMDAWEDVAGHMCEICNENPATHIYGLTFMCCQCHGGDIITPEEAKEAHKKVLEEQKNESIDKV